MEEFYKLISDELSDAVKKRLFIDKLAEVRIRNGFPVSVCYDGKYRYIGERGLTDRADEAFVAGKNEAENVVMRACERSLYTVTDTVRRGYVSVSGGIRIGICGSAVKSGGNIVTFKNFTSVNIRLPHQIKGCAASVAVKLNSPHGIYRTIVISPPGAGKTTVLRDLCRILSARYNVLLCDEKYEIASACDGAAMLDVGYADVMSGADKQTVFDAGIAYMRPDVIMADELFEDDIRHVMRAAHCGISVVATVHARDYKDFRAKREFAEAVTSGTFERFVELSPPPARTLTVYDGSGAAV